MRLSMFLITCLIAPSVACRAGAQTNQAMLFVGSTNSADITSFTISAGGDLLEHPASPTVIGNDVFQVRLRLTAGGAKLLVVSSTSALETHVKLLTVSPDGALADPGAPAATIPFPEAVALARRGNRDFLYALIFAGTSSTPGKIHDAIAAYEMVGEPEQWHLKPLPGSPFVSPGTTGGKGDAGDMVATPDGRFLYVAKFFGAPINGYAIGEDGSLTILPMPSQQPGMFFRDVIVSGDSRHVYFLSPAEPSMHGFEIGETGLLTPLAGSPYATSSNAGATRAVAIMPGGSHVLLTHTDGSVSALNRAADGSLSLPKDGQQPVDANINQITADDHRAYVLDMGCDRCTTSDPTMGVVSLAISPDGTIATPLPPVPAGVTPSDVAIWIPPSTRPIPGDVNGDGGVNVDDLLAVITAWGPCAPPPELCSADVDEDGAVEVDDLLIVITNWG